MTAARAGATPLAAADVTPVGAQDGPDVVIYAAGSLRAAMSEIAVAFERAEPGRTTRLVFGAAGLLRDRIAGGEKADVFASANMEHPLALVGHAGRVHRFARNELCALVSPKVTATSDSLVDCMLDPAIRLGTSTPHADPSGDYALMLFERIEKQGRPGAYRALSEKALQLTGGPQSPRPPAGTNVYGTLVAQGRADIFITYCTNASAALREQPALKVVIVPAAINVSASYGVAALPDADPCALGFIAFLLGPTAQAMLARHGFAAP